MSILKCNIPFKRVCSIALSMFLLSFVAGCAPQSEKSSGEDADSTPLVEVEWSPEAECSICHNDQKESSDTSSLPASMHKENGAACVTCHSEEAVLQSVHEGTTSASKMPKKLTKTSVDAAACTSCHGSADELASLVPDVMLADANGMEVGAHDALTLNEDHQKGITCTSCHVMHESNDIKDSSQDACLNCHHQNVFECHTCHE